MSYLILCVKNGRSRQLGRALWWCPNSNGYTTLLEEAGRYSKEEADRLCSPGENIAVPESEALDKAVTVVVDFGQWEDDTFRKQQLAAEENQNDLRENAKRVAKDLGYMGHHGWENEAEAFGEEVWCSCRHCPEMAHKTLRVISLDPLFVSVDGDDLEEFDSIDDLRETINERMGEYY